MTDMRKLWDIPEDMVMVAWYPHEPTSATAKRLSRSVRSVYMRAKTLGLKKTPEFLASPESGIMIKGDQRGLASRFVKGHTSWNKGKKGLPSVGRMKETQFKKGVCPPNTLHDGAITIRHQHRDRPGSVPYKYIRLAQGKWQELHRYLWVQAHGPIPKGMCICFKDGDSMNCVLGNLEMISMAENLERKRFLDSTVASKLAAQGRGKVDYALKEEYLKHPKLIELKRKQLILSSQIKTAQKNEGKN